jgi:hypothetical protein
MINPNVILDFSNLSPLMSNRIESLSSRIQQARELTVGVRLTAADVTLLTCLCRSSPLPPNPPGDDERIFKNVKFNAEMAQIDGSVGKGSGIFFPRRESAVIDNFLERSLRYREYRRGTKSANMVLPHFMTLYQYYDDDDYHCLDYKMDRSIDYTSHVEIDGGFTELHKCGPSEVEYVAQLYFFAIVAVFEKLEKSQAPSKGTNLKQKEAMALLTWFRQNPPSFYPERHEESVESVASAFSKIHNALASHDPCAEAILTTPEVEHLLAISERVPRPKSVSESGARPNLPSQAPGRVSVGKDANGATAKQQGEDSVPAQTVEVFQTCADILFKFRKQRAAGSGMSIHCTHAQGIWAFCTMHLVRYPELIISPSRNPEHPQVTALAKLDAARRDRYMVAPVHFVLEEVQVLTDVMELPPRELPPSKNQCLFSASNTNSISKGLESTIETILEEKRAGKSGEPVKKPAEPAVSLLRVTK